MLKNVNERALARFVVMFVLGAGWAAFEGFNIVTTNDTLTGLFNSNVLSVLLAFGIVAVDLGGLARLVTPAMSEREDQIVKWVLNGAWAVVAAINASLTWWDVAKRLEAGTIAAPSALIKAGAGIFIPIVIAALVLGVRIMLMTAFGRVLGGIIGRPAMSRSQTIRQERSGEELPHVTPLRVPNYTQRN